MAQTTGPADIIRSLAGGGTTLEQVRARVMDVPPQSNVMLVKQPGAQSSIAFPAVCPNCGQAAGSTLRISRAFLLYVYSDDDTPNSRIPSVDTFDVPFCNNCIQLHHGQQVAAAWWKPFARALAEGEGLGGVLVLIVGLFFLKEGIVRLSLFPVIFAALPLSIGYWLLRSTWKKNPQMTMAKPTAVDAAIDFTPVLSLAYEPAWRAWEFRNSSYAALFRQLNHANLWSPQSAEAQTAAAQRGQSSAKTNLIIGAIVVVVLLWTLWDDYLRQMVVPWLTR